MISARTLWAAAVAASLVVVGSAPPGAAATPDPPAVTTVTAPTPRELDNFLVTGTVVGGVFYTHVTVELDDYTFSGDGGGAFSPGGGYLVGALYASSIESLVARTRSFMVSATPIYVNVTFFDEDHTPIGMVQSAAASMVLGIGGGRGRWKAS